MSSGGDEFGKGRVVDIVIQSRSKSTTRMEVTRDALGRWKEKTKAQALGQSVCPDCVNGTD